ncbi:ribose-5-phosphate isomerase RpiA [Sphingomonas lenta]|uniref:Ribose-5-phosphate isomerase A n=1 Tax=Sphingomonas lenta TaxID=1141887 RepID=A0A2A2SFE9_9SPHN|nr:ribose-5-phosphate isomerase RpiA [Sphingomonas lenta]PAX07969.1 ribose-5-phosphate isomerase [Sphingomonas lenta]
MNLDDDKRLAAEAAVAEVRDGMMVGLGTGSTAAHMIRALGRRVGEGLKMDAVATSHASADLARELGIRVHDFADVARVDLTIDGADEIDGLMLVVKGAGGAMLREKCVAAASDRMVVIADGAKRVERIGKAAVPVEVLPFAKAYVTRVLAERSDAVLRMAGGEAYLTDQGNLVLDCAFHDLSDPHEVAAWLQGIPGVLGHGLFLSEVDGAYLADGGVVTRLERSELG